MNKPIKLDEAAFQPHAPTWSGPMSQVCPADPFSFDKCRAAETIELYHRSTPIFKNLYGHDPLKLAEIEVRRQVWVQAILAKFPELMVLMNTFS